MSDNGVIDLAAARAAREANKAKNIGAPEERDEGWDLMLCCPACENRAFTIYVTDDPEPSFKGHNVICTACDCIVDLTGEVGR